MIITILVEDIHHTGKAGARLSWAKAAKAEDLQRALSCQAKIMYLRFLKFLQAPITFCM